MWNLPNQCLSYRQVDSFPLGHWGSPDLTLISSSASSSYKQGLTQLHQGQDFSVSFGRMQFNSQQTLKKKKKNNSGFPGGPVIKNSPCNAGDSGLISGLGISYRLWGSSYCAPQLWNLGSGACDLQVRSPLALESILWNKRSRHNEKPRQQR